MPLLKLAKLNDAPEIFHTIQGEGINTGVPSVFIRSSLCNLHCHWCDTDYTWNWEKTPWKHLNDSNSNYKKHHKKDWIVELPHEALVEKITSYSCNHLVITGGEPLLQQDAFTELIELLKIKSPSLTIEVESNGTIKPKDSLDKHILQYNISPKLENSQNSITIRKKTDALNYYTKSAKSWFKFVIATEEDLTEILNLIHEFSIPKEKVILMPLGRNHSELECSQEKVVNLCLKHGFRFSSRTHIHIWGSKRGV